MMSRALLGVLQLAVCISAHDSSKHGTRVGHHSHPNARHEENPWSPEWMEVRRLATTRGADTKHQFSTFRSAAIPLDPGRVILTAPKQTPLRMPDEDFVITSFHLQVVRPDGTPVPLTEVYNHHVVFYGDGGKLGADICGGAHLDMIDGLWASGAEGRGTVTQFPDGYALAGQGPWYGNIHFIRSEGVPHVKRCIECACDTGGGSEDCCRHMSICPGFPEGNSTRNATDVKEYALEYTIGWSTEKQHYQIVKYMTLDATGCQLEFQIPATCPWMWNHDNLHGQLPGSVGLRGSGRDLPSDFAVAVRPPTAGCEAKVYWDYVLPPGAAGRVVFSKGHVHIGGISVSAYVLRNGTETRKELLCDCKAKYGRSSPGSATFTGDELGYVVGVSTCQFGTEATQPVLRQGDVIRVEGEYRTDLWFNGVMALFDMAIIPEADSAGLVV
eukprot:TRINITY_DN51627_c0_g1_i1.p1 TRINITY_DN51627_c0_g1~~TRINITY_DN51627_c0_g1_i1.p1  ORF type:complete len:442 (-),score=37.84 TRINITY_DN51627_c0_g1_i1:264-1589(-)